MNKKCLECRFCLYDNDRKEYFCSIKGYYEYSKFIEWDFYKDFRNPIMRKRRKNNGRR